MAKVSTFLGIIILTSAWQTLILITFLSGANADCAAETSEITRCLNTVRRWVASACGGGGPNSCSGADGPSDALALMCTPDAIAEVGCLFKYGVQCPSTIPRFDLTTILGDKKNMNTFTSGANADCAAVLALNSEYTRCFHKFRGWAAYMFGSSDPNGGSGADVPPDMRITDAIAELGCFFKYALQCPSILESIGGEAAKSEVDLTTLFGENPLETICASMPDPSQMTVDPGVTAQTYATVPENYNIFLSKVYMVCGKLKLTMDCAMTKLEEGGCPMEPFEAMVKYMMEHNFKPITFEGNKKFMKDECPTVTDDFKTCVGNTLAKNEFKECYKNATDMYKTRNSCEMFSANKDCLLRTVSDDCGKPAAMWLIKHSPNIDDSVLPPDCEDTLGYNCNAGFWGETCDNNCPPGCATCTNERYGTHCDLCSTGCEGGICSKTDGSCLCINGRYGTHCDDYCSTGCEGGICSKTDGSCSCINGRYGTHCDDNCSIGCEGGICSKTDGSCLCINGRYGTHCDDYCSTGCEGGIYICSKTDGSCSCINGRYGLRCDEYCSTDCEDGICNKMDGSCPVTDDKTWINIVIGLAIAGIIIVVPLAYLIRWQRRNVQRSGTGPHKKDTLPSFNSVENDETEQNTRRETVELALLSKKSEGIHLHQESRISIECETQRCIALTKDIENQDDQKLITVLIEKEPEIKHITSTTSKKKSGNKACIEMADTNKQVITDKVAVIQQVQEPVIEMYPPRKQHTQSSLKVGSISHSFTNDDDTIATPTYYARKKQQTQDDHFCKRSYKNVINDLVTKKRRWKSTSDITSISWSIQTKVNESSQTIGCLEDHDRELVYRNNQQPQDDYLCKRSYKVSMNALVTEKRRWKSTSDLTSNSWSIRTEINESSQTLGCLEDMSLEQVCLIFGLQSEKVNNKCKTIINHLSKINGVKRVWPSYKASNKTSLVFLVLIEPEMDRRELLIPCPLRLKSVKSMNDENDNVESSEVYINAFLSDEDLDKLNNVFDRVVLDMLNVHSNLCTILISPLKSRQIGTELIETPCFVLYVYMKGLIPINECEFPKFIDGIPTDVRDGIFSVFGAHRAKEFHNPLLMGCMLSGFHMGTIGPFLTDQNGKTFCLTSAHVLLTPPEYTLLQSKHKMNEKDFPNGHPLYLNVYQPTHMDTAGNTYTPFGQIRSVIYNDGSPNNAGVEVGLVEVTDPQRTPITGEFPEGQFEDEGFTKDSSLTFKNGLMVDKNTCTVDRTEVFKYGCETGLTSGTFKRSGRNVYRDTLTEGLTITLCNQIQINSIGNTKFAKPGDSGALVLVPNNAKQGDMRAVGIVTGGMNNTISVTPIWDILDGLNQPLLNLKKF